MGRVRFHSGNEKTFLGFIAGNYGNDLTEALETFHLEWSLSFPLCHITKLSNSSLIEEEFN